MDGSLQQAIYVDNETNSRSNGIDKNGIGPNAGGDPKYLGVGLRHLV